MIISDRGGLRERLGVVKLSLSKNGETLGAHLGADAAGYERNSLNWAITNLFEDSRSILAFSEFNYDNKTPVLLSDLLEISSFHHYTLFEFAEILFASTLYA